LSQRATAAILLWATACTLHARDFLPTTGWYAHVLIENDGGRTWSEPSLVVTGTDGETTASVQFRRVDAGVHTPDVYTEPSDTRGSATILSRSTGALVNDEQPPLVMLPGPVRPGMNWRFGPEDEPCSLWGTITAVRGPVAFVEVDLVCSVGQSPSPLARMEWRVGGGLSAISGPDGGTRSEFVKVHR
jgi:hypothetical protein